MPSFIIVGYVWRILGRGAKKAPANPRAGPKKPILNRVSLYVVEPGKKSMMLYFIHLIKRFFSILYILTKLSTLLDLLEISFFNSLTTSDIFYRFFKFILTILLALSFAFCVYGLGGNPKPEIFLNSPLIQSFIILVFPFSR